jgi:nuclear cap-binding protein subunit 1
VSRFVLDDIYTDTLRIFSLNHTECTSLLLQSEKFFNQDCITKNGYAIFESFVECIFAELFRLPKPIDKAPYYNTLIIDLCKESLDKIPSIFGRSVKVIFSRLNGSDDASGMDVEGIKRFADFFAVHLSNFGFAWKWQDWMHVLKQKETSGQFVFVREVFEKCIKLAYFNRIRDNIPEPMATHHALFPASAPTFTFRYLDASTTGGEKIVIT